MTYVVGLTFNPFQENTYIVYDDTKSCVIFDPGCLQNAEQQALVDKINELGLTPVRLINTHCHLDHVFGNKFVSEKYQLPLEIHEGELQVLKAAPVAAQMYGIPYPELSPDPGSYIKEGEVIEFGETKLQALFTPGHSPASLSFYCEAASFVIAGDVLFQGSIGRTDLPGGDYDTLIKSIREQMFTLPDNVEVYPGHGPSTTIGFEKKHNPFFQ
jgi:glyoxylase-like metal-dependent hydrolase (beta-lactamase superfamily II)